VHDIDADHMIVGESQDYDVLVEMVSEKDLYLMHFVMYWDTFVHFVQQMDQ